jgi:predicted regulator of Ras-like GTPase activity (Roadblock/LC7/MglB family)
MKDILNDLNDIPGDRDSLVVDLDGLVIASNLMSGLEERTISAMVANISSEIVRAMPRQDGLSGVQLQAAEGTVIFLNAPECLLAVIAEPGANIGLISIKMKASLERLLKVL